MRVMAWISIALTVILTGGSITAYWFYRDAFGSITSSDATKDILGPRPQNLTGALNVLIVGSDTRAGEGNARYGQALARTADGGGKRTDTMLMLHISPDRDKAQIISLPRDSMVTIPQCKHEKTKAVLPEHTEMINSAYSSGGIACTIATVERNTGLRIDHFVEVDFNGFKQVVDSLGGIEMCFTTAIDDKASKFRIAAGTHVLNGEQALGYMRARKIGSDQSDLQRIKRQQKFISKLIQEATTSNLLTDVGKLRNLIKSTATSVKMDEELANDPEKLLSIAQSMGKLTASGVKLTMVPVQAYPADPNRVQWLQPAAQTLFQQIAQDIEPTATQSAAPAVAVKPEQVRVQVLNGSDRQGEAQRVADELTKWGFKVVTVGNTTAAEAKTRAAYSAKAPDDADYAKVAAAKLSGTKPAESGKVKATNVKPYVASPGVAAPEATGKPGKEGPVVQVIIGADYQGVRVPTTVSKEVEENTVSADQKNICT